MPPELGLASDKTPNLTVFSLPLRILLRHNADFLAPRFPERDGSSSVPAIIPTSCLFSSSDSFKLLEPHLPNLRSVTWSAILVDTAQISAKNASERDPVLFPSQPNLLLPLPTEIANDWCSRRTSPVCLSDIEPHQLILFAGYKATG